MKKGIKLSVSLLFLLISSYFIIIINNLNLLPVKYYILIVIGIGLLNVIADLLLITKKKWPKVISVIIYIILLVISIIGIKYGNETLNFLKRSFNNNTYEITTYDVITLTKKDYKKIDELSNKKMGYISTDLNSEDCLKNVENEVNINNIKYEDIFDLYNDLSNGKIDSILIDEALLDLLEDENDNLNKDIKILYTFDIKNNLDLNKIKVDKLEPINIFVSGSDSRSSKITNKSRSDVNMILTINPKTKTILMTSIPRDYYVQVHGQSGLKDKLTHAGIYGINSSVATVEDLLDIKIDYYIKVGFSSVIELVDLVGGIDIDSDRAFTSHCGDGGAEVTKVKKGMNHFTGPQALSYARERYAYRLGDRHRILNQQQVLEATLQKVITNKSMLLKYNELLDSLSELYRTNIPKDVVTLLVKNQLDNNQQWKFESNTISGGDGLLPTHTAPNSKRYVMLPYEKDVRNAHEKIENVLNEK